MINTNTEFEILTPDGWSHFDGISETVSDDIYVLVAGSNSITATGNHRFLDANDCWITVKELYTFLFENKHVELKNGIVITSCTKTEKQHVYDPINVVSNSCYYANDVFVSHNSFLGSSNTLFSPNILLGLRKLEPIATELDGLMRIYKRPIEAHVYVLIVDVAQGRGQDNSTFNIIDITGERFEQVAVFTDNIISPLLLPDIIYKYANYYNCAWVIVESNDQGAIVCNGLHYDLDYENMFHDSVLKGASLGVKMTKKTKRIGCSNIKDIVEKHKLLIVDGPTIIEMSTFVADGNSYAASAGNHDDHVMNLVLFGWFTSTTFFTELNNDINLRTMLYAERERIEEDLVPFGEIDDGRREYDNYEGGFFWSCPQFKDEEFEHELIDSR